MDARRVNTFLRLHTRSLFKSFREGSFWVAVTVSLSSSLELRTGIRATATKREMIMEKVMVRAISLKRSPAITGTKRMGRKATRVVIVEIARELNTCCTMLMDEFFLSSTSYLNL